MFGSLEDVGEVGFVDLLFMIFAGVDGVGEVDADLHSRPLLNFLNFSWILRPDGMRDTYVYIS